MNKPQAPHRSQFPYLRSLDTRWSDNDVYGHVNNVVYYAFFDTAVNGFLIAEGGFDMATSPAVGLVVETQCTYFSSVAYPDTVTVGIQVEHLGRSSVRYGVALFRGDAEIASAVGRFVHVYVDRDTRRPTAVPEKLQAALQRLLPAGD